MDQKALRILFDRHWDSRGWKRSFQTSAEDFEYAVAAGTMYHDTSLSHDEVVDWLTRVRDAARIEDLVGDFLASLGSRALALRSRLGSYAVARHFPLHKWTGPGHRCAVCGLPEKPKSHDLNVLNFERHKWGGVRHDDPVYAAFDLEEFARAERPPIKAEDLGIFEAILGMVQGLEPDARPRTVERGMANLLRSNKSEREVLVQILGYCGILQPAGRPSYSSGFLEFAERPMRSGDWTYPACWWRGNDGVSAEAVNFFFGRVLGQILAPPPGRTE